MASNAWPISRALPTYPDGFRKHWNDSRRGASHAARQLDVDDKAFLGTLIDQLAHSHDIDTRRVFVFGYSNGGHMAFRLALEMPERIQAIAVVGANLPIRENSIARPRGEAVPALIVNGTEDPINPYVGGLVTLFGFGSRGEVLSARSTTEYLARLNHAQWTGSTELRPTRAGDPTHVVQGRDLARRRGRLAHRPGRSVGRSAVRRLRPQQGPAFQARRGTSLRSRPVRFHAAPGRDPLRPQIRGLLLRREGTEVQTNRAFYSGDASVNLEAGLRIGYLHRF